MSLEDALNRHADAIALLANTLASGVGTLAALKTGAHPTTPAADAAAPGAPAQPAAGRGRRPAAAAPTGAAAIITDPPKPTTIKYEDIRLAFTKLGELKGSQVAIALLAKFGVKNGKELPASRYPDFAEAIKTELPAEALSGLALFK